MKRIPVVDDLGMVRMLTGIGEEINQSKKGGWDAS